jgi:hypothetical protein
VRFVVTLASTPGARRGHDDDNNDSRPHASQEDIVIEVLKGFPDNVAAFACHGHLTKADYETVLIPAIEDKLKRHKKLRAYTEIAPDFAGIEPGAFWEDTKFGFSHLFDWERSALVTNVEWMKHAAKIYAFLGFSYPEGSVRSRPPKPRKRTNGLLKTNSRCYRAIHGSASAAKAVANVPQEARQNKYCRYHRQQGRGNEERKPEPTIMVGMPSDHGEQHGGQEQDEVAPVLGEVTVRLLKLPTLLYGHDEVVDVLCDDLLKPGSTGDLVFRNPLQRVQFRFDEGSQSVDTRVLITEELGAAPLSGPDHCTTPTRVGTPGHMRVPTPTEGPRPR